MDAGHAEPGTSGKAPAALSAALARAAGCPAGTLPNGDKDDCEDLGIVKIDLLALGLLGAIETIDLAKILHDDQAVYDLLWRADTVGTFRVESRAQIATLPILKPK